MLVNPEILAWLNRQSKTELEEKRTRPLVTRGEKINKGGPERARRAVDYAPENDEKGEEVEYLNERKSNLNCYA